jgi:hypothetical protein
MLVLHSSTTRAELLRSPTYSVRVGPSAGVPSPVSANFLDQTLVLIQHPVSFIFSNLFTAKPSMPV